MEHLESVLKKKHYPKNEEFSSYFCKEKLYKKGQNKKKLELILKIIEQNYNYEKPISLESFAIEHIMPQKLTPWWEEHLGSD
ncbi:GmrSD restriction endonuclease domain-containing protein [Candidatus Nitrosacidococcus tergens]|uniref:GmrSD restriction endonuclease domain-containing protein n=1 Tax=Candidatus Nitrosacidococcus tergens TaxID=553981 RepID=UPI0018D94151